MVMAVYATLRYLPEGSDWITPQVRKEHRVLGAAASEVIEECGGAVSGRTGGDVLSLTARTRRRRRS